MTKFIVNVGLFLFFTFTTFFTIIYFWFLYDKIKRPTFKNMDAHDFILFGAIVIAFMTVDFFILRRFIRGLKK